MLSEATTARIIDEAMSLGAEFAEVFDENTFFHSEEVSHEGVEKYDSGYESGVGIRLFSGGNCYYASSNNRNEDDLIELTRRMSRMTGRNNTNVSISPEFKISYEMPPGTMRQRNLPADKLLLPAKTAVRAGMDYSSEIVRMNVGRTDVDQEICIANSEGLLVREHRVKTRLYIQAYAGSGTDLQMGYYGPGAMAGQEFYDRLDIEAAAAEACRTAIVNLHAKPFKGGRMPVVVANGFGGLLFHEACGHSLEATVIARDSSEFSGRIGEKVASDLVTLIDDGSIEGEWGSYHVDDEGIPARKNVLIENGILRGYMTDQLNGSRIGLAPTGSSRRQNYRFAPVARMTNTYIASGGSSPEDIIAATESGIYVKSIIGGSVDPATGDFNFSAGESYMIRNGKICEAVRGVTLIGNGMSVLKSVDMVGNDLKLGQGYCYASSGALFIDAGQPTVRISNMTVGGLI